ncbi:unnamed protein product [Lota lota]
MSFFGPVFANPMVGLEYDRFINASVELLLYIVGKSNSNNAASKGTIRSQQEAGDLDSSEVEIYLNLGSVGTYKQIIRDKRPFSKGRDGDKGYVEADHIPPLDSLRRAEQDPEFWMLRQRNPALYDMVMSLRDDPHGRNLLTVQVSTQHHREALSTGNSRASRAVRGVLARRIARAEVKVMLKQAFIIAHPFVSRQIRDHAEIVNKAPTERILISADRTMDIYRRAFMEVIKYYYEKRIITAIEVLELMQYVENHGYTDIQSSEYKEIFDTVKRSQK